MLRIKKLRVKKQSNTISNIFMVSTFFMIFSGIWALVNRDVTYLILLILYLCFYVCIKMLNYELTIEEDVKN